LVASRCNGIAPPPVFVWTPTAPANVVARPLDTERAAFANEKLESVGTGAARGPGRAGTGPLYLCLLGVKLDRKLGVRAQSAFPTITHTTAATSGVYEFKP